ncbi:H-NS histone family protein [Diaphorobacter sp. HDW4A]|uniref:H-NS histone family protein n=1 Tax=Betaproteobacteria TaxID=28216 RepID=UPI00140E27A7|nr:MULTISPECIES: H-NS histone family protein [Betaproteobacteria]MCK6375982.1 H-NS histone family protein [Zoogloea sp.]MCK6395003.1 H-NS histone family protein [Zoogloea sp.]QIL78989.1 H-NS histone family protein [Diaphorobacter sp. HDW4A]
MARKRTLQEIDREIAKLNQEADAIRASEKAEVAAKMKDAIAYYGFTAADLGLARGGKKEAKASTKAKPKAGRGAGSAPARIKYKDDAGNAWSGFGRKPKWFVEALASGKTAEQLLA